MSERGGIKEGENEKNELGLKGWKAPLEVRFLPVCIEVKVKTKEEEQS